MRPAEILYSFANLCLFLLAACVYCEKNQCKICKDFAKNFDKGIKSTAKSNFGGGNTNWEEKSLGSYAFSETRLIEIMEGVCDHEGKDCHFMVEEHEEKIEKWWFDYYAKDKPTKLEKYLCINTIQVCCPKGTYGKNCLECTGGKDKPCKGNGKCSGDGTREGTGQCECNSGYKGQICDDCQSGHFQELKNNTHTVCKKCDDSCENECTGTGPEGCNTCKKGWRMIEGSGCYDLDECLTDSPCNADKQYCTNTQGSYKCTNCHMGCNKCTGPGAENCVDCAEQYVLMDGKCKACHPSCENSCSDLSATSCDKCTEGWEEDEYAGCVDFNECNAVEPSCKNEEYCTNNEGSYYCSPCHSVCDGCTGSSINNCLECKEGYVKNEDEECKDVNECLAEGTCSENEKCVNTVPGFRCDCKEGFIRKLDECEPRSKPGTIKPGRAKSSLNPKEQCILCRYIGQSFDAGLKRTAKSNFGGGNTAWEQKALGSYAFSESRLIDVMDDVCEYKGSEHPAIGCHRMLEDLEEIVEKWWFKYYAKGKYTALLQYMCVDKLEICCPNGTYGMHCKECQGGQERPCNGNGKCLGDGTREGNGACECNDGYKGMLCNECKDGYYLSHRNKTHYICDKCDEMCKSSCWGPGLKGCDDCKDGWAFDEDKGCIDADECEFTSPCLEDEFCLNTQGSHKCPKCNEACSGCTGPTPDNCTACAEMFVHDNDTCSPCHLACENSCNDTTALTCDACTTGWDPDEELGCKDKNECALGSHSCEPNEFCTNEEGSHSCAVCHATCAGCSGPGIDQCENCKEGYTKNELKVCKDNDECMDGNFECGENKKCVNTQGSYKCVCKDGFKKKKDECIERPKPKVEKKPEKIKIKRKPISEKPKSKSKKKTKKGKKSKRGKKDEL